MGLWGRRVPGRGTSKGKSPVWGTSEHGLPQQGSDLPKAINQEVAEDWGLLGCGTRDAGSLARWAPPVPLWGFPMNS